MDTLLEQIDLQQKKLLTPVYKNIDDRYRKKNIEFETTLVAVGDLESYYQALDTALQRFHTLRVDEINKVSPFPVILSPSSALTHLYSILFTSHSSSPIPVALVSRSKSCGSWRIAEEISIPLRSSLEMRVPQVVL
jgi:hypothetical protein